MLLKTYVEICDIEHDNVIVDYDYQPDEEDTNTRAGIYINEVKCMEATYADEGDKADYDHDYREEA